MTRQIKPALVDYIRARLTGMGLFADAIAKKDPRTIYLLANQAMVGVREKTGNNDGPLVELIQSTIGGAARESWCMSAQQSAIAFAEELTGIRSAVVASEHCLTVWGETAKELRVKTVPLPGAMTIWRHGNTDSGHTGCTGAWDAARQRFESYEGNTEAGIVHGGVVREGGGFYRTFRDQAGSGSMKVVGWLKPFPVLES